MEPDFWLERWRNSQIGFHQQETNNLLQLHWPRLTLPASSTVFVPLCGKSRDMLWLRSRGHRVLGVEFIPIALRDFFVENGLTPVVAAQPPFERWETDGVTLLCGDFFDLTAADLAGVAAVYDRAALIALPRDMRQRYADKLAQILPPTAQTLLIALSYPESEMKGPPFSVTGEEVNKLYGGNFLVERLATQDALGGNPNFRQRGLTQLSEQVYLVRKKSG